MVATGGSGSIVGLDVAAGADVGSVAAGVIIGIFEKSNIFGIKFGNANGIIDDEFMNGIGKGMLGNGRGGNIDDGTIEGTIGAEAAALGTGAEEDEFGMLLLTPCGFKLADASSLFVGRFGSNGDSGVKNSWSELFISTFIGTAEALSGMTGLVKRAADVGMDE